MSVPGRHPQAHMGSSPANQASQPTSTTIPRKARKNASADQRKQRDSGSGGVAGGLMIPSSALLASKPRRPSKPAASQEDGGVDSTNPSEGDGSNSAT